MDPITLIVIFVSTWIVCGINAAKRLDNYYRKQGEGFYDSHESGIGEANCCVFLLGPIGLLGVYLLLHSD